MAARLRPQHQDDIRKKIQADRLIAWMQAGIFGSKFQGKAVDMSSEKVSAAKALLNKVLPDFVRAEVTGKDGGAIQFQEVQRKIV